MWGVMAAPLGDDQVPAKNIQVTPVTLSPFNGYVSKSGSEKKPKKSTNPMSFISN